VEKERGEKNEKKSVRESLINLRFERKAGEKRSGGKCEKKHEKRHGEKQEKAEQLLHFREQLIYLKNLKSYKK